MTGMDSRLRGNDIGCGNDKGYGNDIGVEKGSIRRLIKKIRLDK